MTECRNRAGERFEYCFDGTSVLTPPPAAGRATATFRIPARASWFIAELTEYSTTCRGGEAHAYVSFDDTIVQPGYHVGATTIQKVRVKIPSGARRISLLTDDKNGDPTCDDIKWVAPHFE